MQAMFDCPNECAASCGSRLVSTSPLQSLYLLNSSFSRDRARSLAHSLSVYDGDRSRQIAESFRLVLQRPPSDAEREAAEKLFAGRDKTSALVLICQALLNLNEFAYLE